MDTDLQTNYYQEEARTRPSKGFFDKDFPTDEDRRTFKKKPIGENEHPLQHTWSFWYLRRQGSRAAESYEKNVKLVGSFNTVEGFWNYYSHLVRPNDLPAGSDYHLFKEGIKPMWEDESNKSGGKWLVRLKKGLASRYWEEFLLAIVGEQFDVGDEICGVVLSVRYQEDLISVWNRTANDLDAKSRIQDRMKRILYSVPGVSMEYKPHEGSMKDYTSFRMERLANSALGIPTTPPSSLYNTEREPSFGRPGLERIGRSSSASLLQDPSQQQQVQQLQQQQQQLQGSLPQQQQPPFDTRDFAFRRQ